MNHASRILATLALLMAVSSASAQDVQSLLAKLPGDVNSIAVSNVEAIYRSPIAVKEQWAKKVADEPQPGVGRLPPTVKRAVLATHWIPNSRGVPQVYGVASAAAGFNLEKLAKREEGELETIGDLAAVHSPRNVFFTNLGPNTLGMMFPANRQNFSRWVRESSSSAQPKLSPYLVRAAEIADKEPALVMAIDLQDAMDPKALKMQIGMCNAIAGADGISVDGLTRLVAGARGLTLVVRFTEQMRAEIKVDFTSNPRPYLNVLRPLFLEAMDRLGIGLAGVKDWDLRVEGNHMKLESRVHDNDMRQIMSLIELPSPHLESPGDEGLTPEQQTLMSSMRYFKEVNKLIEDLKVERDRARTHGSNAQWHDNFAKRIEQLPTLGVDPELLAWGAVQANRIRGLSASLRGIGLDISTLDQQKQSFTWVDPGSAGWGGGWGWGGYAYGGYYRPGSVYTENNFNEVRTKQAETVTAGVKDRNEVWNQINADTLAVRTRMSQKYNVDFSS